MSALKCPGQDTRFWSPDDIFNVRCHNCGFDIEFFKDDAFRRCKRCGQTSINPRLNLGCREHCNCADACIAQEYDALKEHEDRHENKEKNH